MWVESDEKMKLRNRQKKGQVALFKALEQVSLEGTPTSRFFS